MRNDAARWTPPRAADARLTGEGVEIRQLHLTQTLISGPAVHTQMAAQGMAPTGWPGPASGDCYALSLRRDRICLIGQPPRPDGWDGDTQQAVSDVSGALAVFEMTGPNVMALLAHGTEIGRNQPSPSVARLWMGIDVWLYAHEAEDNIRLHVGRARAEAVWRTFERLLRHP